MATKKSTTTAAPAVNLFATAKVKETAKKPEKKFYQVDILEDKIKRFNDLKDLIENSTAQLKMLEGDIKQQGKEIYLKEYRQTKMKPDSFKLQDKSGAAAMLIVMDKYTTVDETKAEILSQFADLVEEKKTFKVNADLVEKYGATLSRLIMGSKDIAEEDKGQLIQGEMVYSVKKGTIDRLMQYDNPEQIFELVNPIVALKK